MCRLALLWGVVCLMAFGSCVKGLGFEKNDIATVSLCMFLRLELKMFHNVALNDDIYNKTTTTTTIIMMIYR